MPAASLTTILTILLDYTLAAISLSLGLFFFVYALKYYLSTALVLFSHDERLGGRPAGAPPPLQREPFISVQLPMYNEVHVVDRLLTAATSFEYERYEVIVADDSTDPRALEALERWAEHPRVRISHRVDRRGFKGGALRQTTRIMDPRTELVVIFDADFIPSPDLLRRFVAGFYHAGPLAEYDGRTEQYHDPRIAVVQGYQDHSLNAGENWITRGIRAEFSGSYIIERPGQEWFGGMKMISGSVFAIRADVLREVGWGTSITEDWELTLNLHLRGYRVRYTPTIVAPAECVNSFRRMAKQRMRWAEGHTYNVKRYFRRVLASPHLTWAEKLEFLYYVPYYLQSVLFIVGSVCWLLSELVFPHKIPYWSALVGWSLVLSNTLALLLMNLGGLVVERDVRRNIGGLFSFVLLGTLLAPYQAYAALKALLERDEGGWTRTPKSGHITRSGRRRSWRLRLREPADPRPAHLPATAAPPAAAPRRLRRLVAHGATLLLLLACGALAALALGPAPVSFAARTPFITLSPASGVAGDTITVSGCEFGNNRLVSISWDNPRILLGTATAAPPDACFSTTVTVPAQAVPGATVVIAVSQGGNGGTATAQFMVLPEAVVGLLPLAVALAVLARRRAMAR